MGFLIAPVRRTLAPTAQALARPYQSRGFGSLSSDPSRSSPAFGSNILTVTRVPEDLPQVIRLNFGQMIIKVVYGIEVDSYENEYIARPEQVLANFSEAGVPGRFLIDLIPACEFERRNTICTVHHKASSEACSGVVSRRKLPATGTAAPHHAKTCTR
jgi:hypothetical protein